MDEFLYRQFDLARCMLMFGHDVKKTSFMAPTKPKGVKKRTDGPGRLNWHIDCLE